MNKTNKTILIDGSLGEGGGQILRSSLTLSMLTETPIRMEKIRAKRSRPGLLRQHLAALRASARISCAQIHGDEIHSPEIEFVPHAIQPGHYHFKIGSAGSTTLVLQTILLPLLFASGPSVVRIEGGTHNLASPPFDFIAKSYLPILRSMGAKVEAKLLRPGFYPAGGGAIEITIEGGTKLSGLQLDSKHTKINTISRPRIRATIQLANLPRDIAEREAKAIQKHLPQISHVEIQNLKSNGPGNVICIEVTQNGLTEVFTAFGKQGVRAEKVAKSVAFETKAYLEAGVPVGQHLADQLLLPLAFAGQGSFITQPLSQHTQTNIEIIEMFLGKCFQVSGEQRVNIEAHL